MTDFKLQLLLSKITMALDNDNFENVKGYLREISNSLPEKFNGDWIYCEDKLPEKDDEYLVVWKTQDTKWRFYEIQEYSNGEWLINIPQANNKPVKIIAWQKLPDLPKEDD